ncbi:uncharacterized protein [Argopecten irradians]|uniref:uncharacterized protein n=1 Tax=Argopecten irradians TaxID=31199 RepID=UPI00371B73DD
MNGVTLAVIVTVCVGVTLASTYRRPTYPTHDDDWNRYPHGTIRNGHLVSGHSGLVRNSFDGSVHSGLVRNGFLGVEQVGNAYVGSGLSRVLGHHDTVMYPTHQSTHTGRRYRRSTGDYARNTYGRYPDIYPRYPDVYSRYPKNTNPTPHVYRQRVLY